MENLNNSGRGETAKKWYKTTWFTVAAILTVLVLILACFFGYAVIRAYMNLGNQISGIGEEKDENLPAAGLVEGSGNYWLGAAAPKITIVEFVDFACPYCRSSFPTIREISQKYKNDVKIIVRDYPVNAEYSVELALAARCAGEQGMFWPMYDRMFLNQGASGREKIIGLAGQIGANTERFTFCFDNKKYLADIQNDFADGQKLGVAGTPTWFINRYKIEGDIPREIFTRIIEKLLNK